MEEKAALVLISLVCITFGQTVCPPGWQRFYESCYFFADDNLADWTESVHYCQIHHKATLAVIESRAEDLMLQGQLRHLYKQGSNHDVWFWIGATDTDIEGLWQWYTDYRPLSRGYVNWHPGQPDNQAPNEDCLCYWGPRDFVGWDDHFCDSKAHAICEKNISTLAVIG